MRFWPEFQIQCIFRRSMVFTLGKSQCWVLRVETLALSNDPSQRTIPPLTIGDSLGSHRKRRITIEATTLTWILITWILISTQDSRLEPKTSPSLLPEDIGSSILHSSLEDTISTTDTEILTSFWIRHEKPREHFYSRRPSDGNDAFGSYAN